MHGLLHEYILFIHCMHGNDIVYAPKSISRCWTAVSASEVHESIVSRAAANDHASLNLYIVDTANNDNKLMLL